MARRLWRDGWGYDDVLPYFKKAEGNTRLGGPFHGTDGPLHVEDRRYTHELSHAFVESAVAAGFKRNDDFNGAEQEGAGLYQVTCKKGRRWSVADAYIHPASKRSNFTVRTEAFVMKIDMDGNRATGVTYRRGGVTETTRANAEIVLSAGAIGSPQILMLSGIGPGGHLREQGIDVSVDFAGVGQNLQDHPVSWALFYTKDTSDLAEFLTLGNVIKAQKAGRGPLTSNVGEAGGFFRSRDDMEAPDLQFHMAPSGFYDNGLHEPVRRGLTIGSTLVRVESRGYIKLRSADPTWHPEIDPGYFDDGADLDAMIAGYRTVYDVVGQGPIARYIDEPWDPASSNPTTTTSGVHRPARADALPPRRHLRDGHDRGQRRRPRPARPRRRGPARRRRLRHAPRPPRQHERPHHHGRRKSRRPHQGVPMTATIEPPAPGAASSGATFDSLNPANGDVVGVHPICSKADVDAAVRAPAKVPPGGARCRSASAPNCC